MADAVNYRQWIYSRISRYIGQRIVELGAGIGNFTESFLDRELVVAVDNYNPCIEYLEKRFSGHGNVVPVKMDISSHEILSLSRYKPDTIICINVLEHVKDDSVAVSHMFQVLSRGGHIVLFVPAFQFLYGNIDRSVGHHRRYSKNELKERLIVAGFKLKDIFYMNSIGTIGWFLNNKILKRKEESASQVIFYDRFVVPWLKHMEYYISPPLGLSLIAIGEK
ncbi:MAG: class I SAM-dependent methyltransferase [Nitrospirota bacterium]|nr:class I SAM-dependent methyltransferase [Nitrospirota bacterium]